VASEKKSAFTAPATNPREFVRETTDQIWKSVLVRVRPVLCDDPFNATGDQQLARSTSSTFTAHGPRAIQKRRCFTPGAMTVTLALSAAISGSGNGATAVAEGLEHPRTTSPTPT
jgi:hypothetical protein